MAKMRGRKGIEMSVNFIVAFILAIVLFGMGIIIARMIMGGGTELTEETYRQFDQQVGELICSRGESICISVNNKAIKKDKVDVFPITVKNDLPEKLEFKMKVELARAFKNDNSEIPPDLWNISWMPDEQDFTLGPGESNTLPVLVKPEKWAYPGKYSFSVYISYNKDGSWMLYPDDRPHKFYVDVS